MTKNRYVVVIGNIGSGKSTLTRLLEQQMPAIKIPADSLYKTNPFFTKTLLNRDRWSLASDLWFLKERAILLQEVNKYIRKRHVVVDSGLPMSLVYAKSRLKSGYFTNDEWLLYQYFYDKLVYKRLKPDVIIYLRGSVDFLLSRIEKRGRNFETKHFSKKYLEDINKSLEDVNKKLEKKKVRVISVNSSEKDFLNNPEQVTGLVKEVFK